jgi:CarboxypepD_reg-like domain
MKHFLFIIFLIPIFSFAQIKPTGKVINAATKEPIAGANVFITNTSYKTITDAEGNFTFPLLNIQKGELVVNSLGLKHGVFDINIGTAFLNITLEPLPTELESVVINNYMKDGYKKWGRLFLDGFIGTTDEAVDCRIDNKDVLKFYFDKKLQRLIVDAREPLKIKNKALGYEIDYTLEHFEYNTKSRILFFSGYPVFSEMKGSKKKIAKWKEKRNECYAGSVMHFMRALYRNKITEEGFIVQKANKILNAEKAAIKENIRKRMLKQTQENAPNAIIISSNVDEGNSKIMNQPDSIYQIISQILPADSFAFAIDSLTAGMYFEKHLIITYKKIIPVNTSVSSFVCLLSKEPLSVFQNGLYYNSMSFFTERYWAETERIARSLPLDYIVEKENKN